MTMLERERGKRVCSADLTKIVTPVARRNVSVCYKFDKWELLHLQNIEGNDVDENRR